MNTRTRTAIFSAAAALAAVSSAPAQSLFERRAPSPAAPTTSPMPANPGSPDGSAPAQPGQPAAAAVAGPMSLEEVSMFAVTPPAPRQWAKHDIVEVIVNRSSVEKFEQTLDTKKDYDLMAELREFPSVRNLLEMQLRTGDSTGLPVGVDVTAGNKFKGDGEYERKDQITTRLAAIVVDVKPNGTLVLEAKDSHQSGEEIKTMVLSGVCRSEDITKNNTIQSSQLANFVMKIEHEGQVQKAGEKGFIPKILEAIFNF
jgi:flagellar L-ring protein precursor FlgH